MYNWVGRFSFKALFCVLLICGISSACFAQEETFEITKANLEWKNFEVESAKLEELDRKNGISYIISGSLALAGGIYGASISDDAAEKLIYTVFQTIGVASVGYGGYMWQIGGEERALHDTLSLTSSLSDKQKTQVLRAYYFQKKERLKKERFIKAITHGLIAAINIYNATQQDDKSKGIRNALFFIGGINTLAAISYTFEF